MFKGGLLTMYTLACQAVRSNKLFYGGRLRDDVWSTDENLDILRRDRGEILNLCTRYRYVASVITNSFHFEAFTAA